MNRGGYMPSKNAKKVSIRKYVNYSLFLVAIVIICLLGSKLYNMYKENNLSTSVLARTVGVLQYDDIDNAIGEFVSDDFILISYTKSKDTRKLENGLKKIIINNNLENNFFYLDATELMLEDNYINTLNTKFKLTDKNKIEAIPALLYYKNGEFVKTTSSTKNTIISSDELAKIIDEYEINQIERVEG